VKVGGGHRNSASVGLCGEGGEAEMKLSAAILSKLNMNRSRRGARRKKESLWWKLNLVFALERWRVISLAGAG